MSTIYWNRKNNEFFGFHFLFSKDVVLPFVIMAIFLFTNSSSTSVSLGGQHFKFIAFNNPPFDKLIREPNGTFTYFGSSYNILEWLSKRLNFTFDAIPVNETLEEKYGTHEASFYQVINDEDIDGTFCPFYITLDRKERMDFTFLSWSDVFRLVVPVPEEESRLFAFVKPFSPTVWLLILITSIVVVGMMSSFAWVYNYYYKLEKTANDLKNPSQNRTIFYLSANTMYIINILTNQGCREIFHRFSSFRVLAGFWLLGAMVLVNSYSGIIISSLTVTTRKPGINSFEDLAASQDIGVVLRYDVSIGEQLLQAKSGIYKEIADKARLNPNQIVGDPVKLNKLLETGRYAYPFIHTFGVSFVATQYKKDGRCRFKVSKPLGVSTGFYSHPMKKGNPNIPLFNKGLMDLWESGLARFWVTNLTPKANKCFASENKRASTRQVAIRLQDLTSAFLILGIGLGLATFCYLLELIYFKFHRMTRNSI